MTSRCFSHEVLAATEGSGAIVEPVFDDRLNNAAECINQRNLWVVILAGGDGRRTAKITRDNSGRSIPKQYCSLDGGPSLLQLSIHRARGFVPQERIAIVVTESHRRWWEPELTTIRRSMLVVQPSNRGSALGVLLPLLLIARADPQAAVVCLPCDHYVEHEDVFVEHIRQVSEAAVLEMDRVTLLGMRPDAPDSGFGYIVPARRDVGLRPVHKFIANPDVSTAGDLIRSGGVWNSGITVGRIAEIVRLYPRHVAGLMLDLKAMVEYWEDSQVTSPELAELYHRHSVLDFSRDVLATHASSLQFLAVPPCGWHDVGNPDRLAAAIFSLRSRRTNSPPLSSTRFLNLANFFERSY